MIRLFFGVLLAVSVSLAPVAAKTLFEQGEALYMQNKPAQAAVLLESALQNDSSNAKAYLYLGICYEQMGQHQKAIDTLLHGASYASGTPGVDAATFYFDIGNNYLAMADLTRAADMYTRAIALNSSYAAPYLNRANVRVKTKQYDPAIADYTVYLNLAPSDPQAPEIQKMIALLSGEVTAEQQRVAEEKKKQEEIAAKRKALLENVLNSLNNAGSDTKNMSGGNAAIQNQTAPLEIAP
ncbi:MAG TPA: tetratricopeptide repeat protein [Spirochaetia bacterium]|nr:tetratricopeptide repeat protein [Spirochaetia bacterium]